MANFTTFYGPDQKFPLNGKETQVIKIHVNGTEDTPIITYDIMDIDTDKVTLDVPEADLIPQPQP
jgi:hypothetical protein